MEKTLNLIFEDSAKGKTTISLDNPKDDLTDDQVKQAAKDIVAANILISGKGFKLLKPVAANVTTKTVETFTVAD